MDERLEGICVYLGYLRCRKGLPTGSTEAWLRRYGRPDFRMYSMGKRNHAGGALRRSDEEGVEERELEGAIRLATGGLGAKVWVTPWGVQGL